MFGHFQLHVPLMIRRPFSICRRRVASDTPPEMFTVTIRVFPCFVIVKQGERAIFIFTFPFMVNCYMRTVGERSRNQ
ncbi:hypothetical protein WA026_013801 [Henosepilachna vigintioctopunctata]|uniref:Uncharacterized protein n=1 Tax=Henosepilachna vigintioctopunctata TaxID=420089 RepID=A0AAW1USY9_9CUCU